jgi:hypothetical protein
MLDCIDALDPLSGVEFGGDGVSTEEKERAEQLVEHLHTCQPCTVAVIHARKLRDRQRRALHDLLEEGETQVASTTANILLALRREQATRPPFFTSDSTRDSIAIADGVFPDDEAVPHTPALPAQKDTGELPTVSYEATSQSSKGGIQEPPVSISTRPSMRWMRRKKTLSYIFALAAAAAFIIVFAQFARLFSASHSVSESTTASSANGPFSSANGSGKQAGPGFGSGRTLANAPWSSLLLTRRSADGKQQLVENYDPKTGKAATLLTLSPTASVDGISHHGDDIVYHDYDSLTRRTTYHFLSGGEVPFNGKGLNAVWSTDDAYIFVVMDTGDVWRVTMATMQPTRLPFNIQADTLVMELNFDLYYAYAHSLYRINVMSGKVEKPQLIVSNAATDVFWIDPFTTKDVYYYANSGNAQGSGPYDLYSAPNIPAPVPANASKESHLIAKAATLIGYSSDGNLMTMVYDQLTQSFGLYKIVDGMPKLIQTQIMKGSQALCQVANASQGSICDSSVALAPGTSGLQMLVVGALYPDKSYRVTAFGGNNFQQLRVLLSDGRQVALIGWDKLIVP